MTTAVASLTRYRDAILIDVMLLTGLYLLPSFSHLTSWPLYKFEPMRIALIIALLFTHRVNAYMIAFTIPLVSAVITGHPEPFKALLMGIEFSVLVAAYGHLVQRAEMPPFLALAIAILAGKALYYALKFLSLSAGLLDGTLISTPVMTQVALALGTAAVFGLIESNRKQPPGR